MKILVSSLYFHPDHSGIALYSSDFSFYMKEAGYDVNVVTGFSFYPKWEKTESDKRKLFRKDIVDGVNIFRGYLYVPAKVSTFKRIIQEMTFILFAFFNFFRVGRSDVIVLFTPPITVGLVGVLFRKLWKARLVINVQDLQLEAADALGLINISIILKIVNVIEQYTYRQADKITSISEGMLSLIQGKNIQDDKIYFWPNWIDVREHADKGQKGNFLELYPEFKGKLIIGYAGNIGVKQGLSVFIDLAVQYQHKQDVVFLIVGEGADLPNLRKYALKQNANHVHFLPFLDPSGYYDFLADIDVIFLSQKKGVGDVYFPSKLLGIMAKSKLLLVSAEPKSELFKVVKQNKIGMTVPYGDVDGLIGELDRVINEKESLSYYTERSLSKVMLYDRKFVLDDVIRRVIKEPVSIPQ